MFGLEIVFTNESFRIRTVNNQQVLFFELHALATIMKLLLPLLLLLQPKYWTQVTLTKGDVQHGNDTAG
jgi:hypothetical protein